MAGGKAGGSRAATVAGPQGGFWGGGPVGGWARAPGGVRNWETAPWDTAGPHAAPVGADEPAERQAVADLEALLPGGSGARREVLREAVTWLVGHLDQPQVVAARCAELGPVVVQLGVPGPRLEVLGLLLLDVLRANPPGVPVRPEQEAAWRDSGRLVARWVADGAAAAAHEPAGWSAVVVAHDRRRADVAVVRVRTYLPYPCRPGQLAVVEAPRLPGRWRECWVGNAPDAANLVELHVPLYRGDPVGAELVERTAEGDRLRLRPAVGAAAFDPLSARPLLVVAERDAGGPVAAVLSALRAGGDRRPVTVFWPAATQRDLFRMVELAPEGATLVRDRFVVDGGDDWTGHDVFVAGTAAAAGPVAARLRGAGVAAERIVVSTVG